MKKDFIQLYAPGNASKLTQDDLAAMADLTMDELKQLAMAYPNRATQPAYLVLKDKTKPEKGQAFPLNTWNNLYELHRAGQTNYVAISFKSIFNRKEANLKVAPVQDLTNDEAKNELKTGAVQKAAPGLPSKKVEPQTATEVTGKKGQEQPEDLDNDVEEVDDDQDTTVPLNAMGIPALKEKYQEVLGKKAPATLKTKKQLVTAIEKASK